MFYGSDNFSVGVGLSIASPTHYSTRYMADQTFHTPNFGDEEFDIPPIALPPSHDPQMHHNMSYTPMGMHGGASNQGQLSQQHYSPMYLPEHMTTPMTMNSPVSYGGSPPTYTTLSSPHAPSQSSMGNPQQQQQHMMHPHTPQQGARPQSQTVLATSIPPRRSPSNNSTSPGNPEATTSDDSDDSVPHTQGAGVSSMLAAGKRPSPEPDVRTATAAAVVTAKKQKAQKKKKKRDPNEPQKPVSAYALFFRDTQAAIKGQNPNASFGEVSKIVASMWDALDADHKNVYKKKTEAAKKDYLKALAAYRASLVSKGAPTDSPDGGGMYPPPNFNANMSAPQQHYQQPQNYYGNQSQQPQAPQLKKSAPSQQPTSQQSMPPPPAQQQPHQPPTHQMMPAINPGHHLESQHYVHGPMSHNQGYMGQGMQMGDGHAMGASPNMHPGSVGGHGQMGAGSVMNHMGSDGQSHSQRQACIRNGCSNVASSPLEADMQGYDEGYCSSQCVVSHCRDVFTNWVTNNQPGNQNYGNPMKYSGSTNSPVVGADGLSYVT